MTYIRRLKKLSQSGVTLVELLIVMGLLSILLVILLTIFTATISNQGQTKAYAATVSDGRFIMARLNYDIARASAIITPTTLGASSSSLGLVIGGDTFTYSLNGGDMQLTDANGTDSLNGNDTTVTSASFQELGSPGQKPTIRYSFALRSATTHNGVADTISLTETAGLR